MNNVYIGNLDLSATEDQVRALLEPHGSIATVTVIRDRHSGQSLGVAFVEMGAESQAQSARNALNGTILGERRLEITRTEPPIAPIPPSRQNRPTRLLVQKVGRVQIRCNQRCTVVYERTRTGWRSYSPEVPGCVAAAAGLITCKVRMATKLKLQVTNGQRIRKVNLIRTCQHLIPSTWGSHEL